MADTLTRRAGKKPQVVNAPRPREVVPNAILARCKPRGDRVVVRRELPQKETKGGILLPDSIDGKRPVATVWAVGPGRYDERGNLLPINLVKGQKVIITSYAGLEVKDGLGGATEADEFLILREEDIIATVDD